MVFSKFQIRNDTYLNQIKDCRNGEDKQHTIDTVKTALTGLKDLASEREMLRVTSSFLTDDQVGGETITCGNTEAVISLQKRTMGMYLEHVEFEVLVHISRRDTGKSAEYKNLELSMDFDNDIWQ